jgi:hypothetical protein
MKKGGCKSMKRCKASYTVEAAVIIPLAISVMALAMRIGIMLCREVKEIDESKSLSLMWEVEDFYKYQTVEEVIN